MTLLGKALVLLNLAFGLLLAGWAFNMYANGIDWTDHKEGNVPSGMFAIREAALDEMWKSVPPAQMNWQTEQRKLQDVEKRLVADRVWYDNEMRHVFVGPTLRANPPSPLGEVAFTGKAEAKKGMKGGQVLLDDRGFPVLTPLRDRAGNPLKSLAEYTDEDEAALRTIDGVIEKHRQQITRANELTDLIIGDKGKGVRGLQERIEDEKVKDAGILDEQDLIEPQRINTIVESELIFKRRNQMEKRVEELKRGKVARK